MKLFNFKSLIICILICTLTLSLCACGAPYVDQNFIDINSERPTTVPTEDTIPDAESTPPTNTQPENTTPPETKPSNNKKPGGFILDDTPPATEPTQPSEPPVDTDTPKDPTTNTQPGNQNPSIALTAGMKKALISLGSTTNSNITAYNMAQQEDGGVGIVNIHNSPNSAIQKTYVYYESKAAYNEAKLNHSADACNDSLQLILVSTTNVLPIANPETLALVLFGGYTLWR